MAFADGPGKPEQDLSWRVGDVCSDDARSAILADTRYQAGGQLSWKAVLLLPVVLNAPALRPGQGGAAVLAAKRSLNHAFADAKRSPGYVFVPAEGSLSRALAEG